MRKTNLQLICELKKFLYRSRADQSKYCTRDQDFTRARKLSLARVVGLLINLPRRSLSVEIKGFLTTIGLKDLNCSKSAFSQARYKLKHCFFEDWNRVLQKSFYRDNVNRVKKWKDFIVLGVDGSTLHLFEDAAGQIADHFGKHCGAVVARAMCCFDVLNGISYRYKIAPYKVSEDIIARQWLQDIGADLDILGHTLLLYDMNFPGFAMAYEHLVHGLDFLIRSPLKFNHLVYNFVRSKQKDIVTQWYPSKEAIKELCQMGYEVDKHTFIEVRLTKVWLDSGKLEVLISSLVDQSKYHYEDFGPLYFKRWASETNYDYWKNKAQVENFSGHSVEAIYQDCYATVFTANLHSVLMEECDQGLKQINQGRKFDYALNTNVGLGLLKDRIVQLFFNEKPQLILDELKRLFLLHLEPVRPNRKYSRNRTIQHMEGKYMTMTNYRRCI